MLQGGCAVLYVVLRPGGWSVARVCAIEGVLCEELRVILLHLARSERRPLGESYPRFILSLCLLFDILRGPFLVAAAADSSFDGRRDWLAGVHGGGCLSDGGRGPEGDSSWGRVERHG